MKKWSNHKLMIILATTTLLGLGIIQINWIVQAHRLKQEQLQHQLKELTPKIAVALEVSDFFTEHKIIDKNELFAREETNNLIDSMMIDAGFSLPIYHAIFQEKTDGIFYSNAPDFEQELRNSDYKTCLSCIITIKYMIDTLKPITPEMVFIRSVSEMETLGKNKADFLWVSIIIPNEKLLSRKAILGLFLLTILLMGILIGLFYYILKSLAQQKKLRQVKDDFFNNMTHEFKTPLASILLASKTLRKSKDNEKRNNYLNLIETESKKLEGQVDKILQLSLIESSQMTFQKEEVHLHQIIQEVVQRLKIIIENKEANIQTDLQLSQPIIEGDAAHLSNCIYNLVENALKYSGNRPEISITTFSQNGQKIIAVKDKGAGIPKAQQAEIFDRFYRGQTNDQYKGQGFGIGLSYVKAVIEAHGGSVFLNANYREGCEFLIHFK